MSELSRLNQNNTDLEEIEQLAEELPDVDPDTSDATATASDIISGRTAWAANKEITGTIEDKRNATSIATVNNIIDLNAQPSGVTLEGNIDTEDTVAIKKDTKVTSFIGYDRLAMSLQAYPEKIKVGETICGITGIYTGPMTEQEYQECLDMAETILE